MSKHTDGAVKAAKRLDDVYVLSDSLARKRSEETGQPLSLAIREKAEQDILKCLAYIIDRGTGLPEITAERDKLLKVNIALRKGLDEQTIAEIAANREEIEKLKARQGTFVPWQYGDTEGDTSNEGE